MTPLRRFATTVTPFFVLGACAQLIGLSDYDSGEVERQGGAGGEGDATSGGSGAKTSGGTAGSSETGGTAGVLGTGGFSRGGKAGDGGAAGDPGGDGGRSGSEATGGKSTGGSSGKGGAAGLGGQGGSAGTGTTGGSGGTGGTAGSPTCTEVTVSTLADLVVDRSEDPHLARYVFELNPELGLSNPDYLDIQFWNGGTLNGISTGTFMLGSGRDANNSTCARCFLVHQDEAAAPSFRKIFFQTSGTLTVSSTSQQMDGFPNISYTDVTLREAIIDVTDGHSTIVPGGACVHIASASFNLPPEWTCDPLWEADGECDCGCGIPDTDCGDPSSAYCAYCWCDPTNTYGYCPSFENPTSNWMCL